FELGSFVCEIVWGVFEADDEVATAAQIPCDGAVFVERFFVARDEFYGGGSELALEDRREAVSGGGGRHSSLYFTPSRRIVQGGAVVRPERAGRRGRLALSELHGGFDLGHRELFWIGDARGGQLFAPQIAPACSIGLEVAQLDER